MSVHDYHVVVVRCEADTTHATGKACAVKASFSGYCKSIAEKDARKAGWRIESVGYLKHARCPNRVGRRHQ